MAGYSHSELALPASKAVSENEYTSQASYIPAHVVSNIGKKTSEYFFDMAINHHISGKTALGMVMVRV